METFVDVQMEDDPEDEQGIRVCGIHCNECIILEICMYKDIFRTAAL